ncbi:MAG: RNase adapter RapZ [Holophagaceae bacterium]|nr:RNase adapter RapZ [Holophagaceae bacterium]
MELIIVTGLSGAGRRSVLGVLEDVGFVSLDNVPIQLLGPLLELEGKAGTGNDRIAVGMDSRHLEFPQNPGPALAQLQAQDVDVNILYLECKDEILIRRYSESRRPHRYAGDGNIAQGIAKERELLQPVRELASTILDTSSLNLYQLRQSVAEIFPKNLASGTQLRITSFGFKYGLPSEADSVFDARFLPNPFYVPELRQLTGQNSEIQDYLKQFKEYNEFLLRLEDWLVWSWPHILEESKAYHNVAIGCTGGHHRSVALAEELAKRLVGKIKNISIHNRDIKK